MGSDIFEDGPARGVRSAILLTQFEGAMDAGAAGALAVAQLLHTLPVQRVATFDSDSFVDWRSHRPLITVRDWVTSDVEVHRIALDLVHDDRGTPILLLHGPEPDMRWETFARAVGELAAEAGVEMTVSLHGMPAGVPHTRPVPVHVQATDASLVPDQPRMVQPMQFPAPMTSFLQARLAEEGRDGVALLAAVPYYLADQTMSASGSALLNALADLADLSLPVGDLERAALDETEAIAALVEAHPAVAQTVEMLETNFDALSGAPAMVPTSSLPRMAGEPEGEGIAAAIEAYLASLAERGDDEVEWDGEADDEEDSPETVADVLARLERRRSGADDPKGRHRARHRAPSKEVGPGGSASRSVPGGATAATGTAGGADPSAPGAAGPVPDEDGDRPR